MRSSRSETANGALGMNAARIRKIFAGRWVNTMVLMRPIRAASHEDTSCENPARIFARKKTAAAVSTARPNR
jgi:hypothetical protein